MSVPPNQMTAMVDSALEAVPGVEVELPEIEDFAGGAEVIEGPDGAIVQAMETMGVEVQTEQYDHSANLAEVLDDTILGEISSELRGQYEADQESRAEWEEGYTKGLDLLGIQYEERTQPFQGASGVTHPIIAESVTQFQAQAYKELLPSGGPVRTNVLGMQDSEKEAQAVRVKDFMNYMLMEVMEEFDPDTDQMLFYLPLSGSTFKKVYFDETKQRPVSKFVPAEDLVVSYAASDLATASRITHVLRMDENEIRKLQVVGFYRDVDISADYEADSDPVKSKVNELDGVEKSVTEDLYTVLEMHVNLDIEGFEDVDAMGESTGIKLPYIVTMDQGSGEILAIRRNYEENDMLKKKVSYFVHYKFLPGLGFYGFGLIHMIGGLGKAATSILRQLIDAGTLANLPSGFKARGIRVRNDDEPIAPGEFRDIDAPGGDIRNSIIPLPYKEPSATLGQLLGVLIESGRRFVSIADQQTGSPGSQSQPVGTTVALLERGMKVMSAIHKRLHYAQKTEFRILARLIRDNMPPSYPYSTGVDAGIKQSDFDDRVDILPVSDPNIFSMAQRITLAQTQLQLAQSNPELHNLQAAYKRMYQALEVQNIDEILPAKAQPQPTDPGIENARALAGEILQAFPDQNHDAHIAAHTVMIVSPIVQASPSVYGMLVSHCMEHISFKARIMVQEETQAELQQVAQQSPAMAQQAQSMVTPQMIESRVSEVEAELIAAFMQSIQPQGQEQDPLVGIRQQELMIRASEVERQRQLDRERMNLEQQKLQQRAVTDAARLELQEDIADQRAEVNLTRIQAQQNRN
tara:strand:- start:1078 stop:3492 length:2415 start_codon:yes stop_codon:yes gene_type:complete